MIISREVFLLCFLILLPLAQSQTYKCTWAKKTNEESANTTIIKPISDAQFMLSYLQHQSGECSFLYFNEKTVIVTLFDPKYRNQRFLKVKMFLQSQYSPQNISINQTVKVGFALFQDSQQIKEIQGHGRLQISEQSALIMMQQNGILVEYHEETYFEIIVGILIISLFRMALSKIISRNRPTPQKLSFITFHYYLSITASIAFMELIYGIANLGSIYSLILLAFIADFVSLLIMCKDFGRLFERARANIDTITYYILVYGYNFLLSHSFYENWFIIANSFFLLPQIVHNIQTGNRFGNHWAYVTLLCLSHSYFIYIKLFPDNLARIKPQPVICIISTLIVGFQVTIIILQSLYGPIFIFKELLIKNYYNYQERINIGSDSQIIDEDCSICLYPLSQEPGQIKSDQLIEHHSDIIPISQNPKTKIIMKTPCNHRFHVDCLNNWMDIKLECPIDRAPLPPIF